ncbi:DUF3604 domain-containing protein [Photobacterium sagamiensis]|uniref:DUF3604 domain-containing protein n=1 Tax=Photobacterium sagamiensis TaxID=2910241 RepID=UPI003D0B8CD3
MYVNIAQSYRIGGSALCQIGAVVHVDAHRERILLMIKKILLGFLAIILILLAVSWAVGSAAFFDRAVPTESKALPRPIAPTPLTAPSSDSQTVAVDKQILFGDLHVHTSFSIDAALTDTPAAKGTSYTSPGDACDFARYCSALDFWSINDHAESLTKWQWDVTKDAVRNCDAATDPTNPDMVSFLGWEWSNGAEGLGPKSHYGHKNVMFKDTAEDLVPTRPIAADNIHRTPSKLPAPIRGLAWLAMSNLNLNGYQALARQIQDLSETEDCANGDVRDLPADCYELASTPNDLFKKLDQWDFEAIVIPHGLAWGNTNPAGSDFNNQMDQLNDKYQRLVEVYSGHGNSEVFSDINSPTADETICPVPSNGYIPCCWQSGEIIRQRCEGNGNSDEDCDQRAVETREMYMANRGVHSQFSKSHDVVPDTTPDDWGQCDQLVGEFQSAFYYRPKQSAQYMLTLGEPAKDGEKAKRFRPGIIASSDTHAGRPGMSYKEQQRVLFTDVKEHINAPKLESAYDPEMAARQDQPVEPSALSLFPDSEDLSNAFYVTGGLVAVNSEGRSRDAIWDALYRREVYGTSGPRIGLWFDMIDGEGNKHAMGSEVSTDIAPRFSIKGVGSIKQKPGCPDYATEALGADRVDSLCRGECYNPSNESYDIERIEVVRILPRQPGDGSTEDLIQDPWRTFECEPGKGSCEVEFTDEEFVSGSREIVYYARVIQEATDTIQGDPLGCEYDENGQCVKTNICMGGGSEEDCISPAEHRAWSSPIYLMPK